MPIKSAILGKSGYTIAGSTTSFFKNSNILKKEYVAEGVKAEGVEVTCKSVGDTRVEDLLKADGIIMGSPTYYGTMAAEVKKFLESKVKKTVEKKPLGVENVQEKK